MVNSENNIVVGDLALNGKFSLRCRCGAVQALEKALGVSLPTKIGDTAEKNGRIALCLGPDEWTLYCDEADRDAVTQACAGVYEAHPHSLTDITFREVGIEIAGPEALTLLSTCCPRDLSRLAAGSGRRTVFDTAQVILLRKADDVFHLYVWRSFYPHVRALMTAGENELALGI